MLQYFSKNISDSTNVTWGEYGEGHLNYTAKIEIWFDPYNIPSSHGRVTILNSSANVVPYAKQGAGFIDAIGYMYPIPNVAIGGYEYSYPDMQPMDFQELFDCLVDSFSHLGVNFYSQTLVWAGYQNRSHEIYTDHRSPGEYYDFDIKESMITPQRQIVDIPGIGFWHSSGQWERPLPTTIDIYQRTYGFDVPSDWDYYPFAIRKNEDWHGCNRSGGYNKTLENGSWRDVKCSIFGQYHNRAHRRINDKWEYAPLSKD